MKKTEDEIIGLENKFWQAIKDKNVDAALQLSEDPCIVTGAQDVAVVAYKVHGDMTVEGKKVSFDAFDSSTWIRRDGTWKCALHTEALEGDPYGRDRANVQ